MSDVAVKVKKIIVEHLGVDEAKVTDEASFIEWNVYGLIYLIYSFIERIINN